LAERPEAKVSEAMAALISPGSCGGVAGHLARQRYAVRCREGDASGRRWMAAKRPFSTLLGTTNGTKRCCRVAGWQAV